MAQTAAERQSNYRRRQRAQTAELQARNVILEAYALSFCIICHCHMLWHGKLGCYDCDCKGFVRATEPKEETEG